MGETAKNGSWTKFNIEFEEAYNENDVDTIISIVQRKVKAKTQQIRDTGAFDREDVEADIVIRVFRCLPQYDPSRGKPSTFVNLIADSVICNVYRNNSQYLEMQRDSIDLGTYAESLPSQQSTLDLLEVEFELFARTLTDKEQEVAKLRMQGYKNTQIAEKLGISKQRVGVIVDQIRSKFESA